MLKCLADRPMTTKEFHVFWPQRACDSGETEFFAALERVAQPLVLCTGSGRSHGKLFLCNLDFDLHPRKLTF